MQPHSERDQLFRSSSILFETEICVLCTCILDPSVAATL